MMARVSLDPHAAEFVRDPYAFYQHWRHDWPVFHWEDLGLLCFPRHAEVAALLRDRRFGRQILHIATREELGWANPPDHLTPFHQFEQHSLLELEPPVHTRLRNFINPSFLPRKIEHLRPRIEELAHDLIDGFEADGETDLLAAFATPVPIGVISGFLGVPEAMGPQLLDWSHDMVAIYQARRNREIEDRAVAATVAFSDYVRELLAARRKQPGNDVLSELLAARDDNGGALSDDEMVTTAILLLTAGHEATVNAISNGVHALITQATVDDFLMEPTTCIEEMLRFDPPLHMFRRYVLEDLEFAGVTLQKGDQVGLLLGSANRDSAKFPEAETFQPRRQPNQHLSFGGGLHFCVGAPLARLELKTALGVLFKRLPKLRLAGPVTFRDTWHFRALESLPVRW